MAILAMEGFELYGTAADVSRRWIGSIGGSPSIVTGRGGVGKALRRLGNSGSDASSQPLLLTAPATTDTIIIGAAIKNDGGWPSAFSGSGTQGRWLLITNSSGAIFAALGMLNGFPVWARCTSPTSAITVVATATSAASIGIWTYIEAKVKLHASTGTVDFTVNGVAAGSFTGLNTAATGTIFGGIHICNANTTGTGADFTTDDVYALDSSGTRLNNFLGDVRVVRAALTGVESAEWSRNTGADNLAAVNDTTSDDDTSYTYSNTVEDRDLFNVGALTASVVHAVDVRTLQRKEDAGSGAIKLVGVVGTDEVVSGSKGVGPNYEYRNLLLPVNPDTGLAWEAAELADLAVGYELVGT